MDILKAILLTLFFMLTPVRAEYFSASILAADWSIKKSASLCHLKHDIPLFGTADFLHQSGELLRFSIRETRYKPEIIKANLSIDKAPWIHDSIRSADYPVLLETEIDIQNYPRLSVYGNTAETMLDAMSKGMFPTFTYVRATSNQQFPQTHVAVSSVNFAKKYQ